MPFSITKLIFFWLGGTALFLYPPLSLNKPKRKTQSMDELYDSRQETEKICFLRMKLKIRLSTVCFMYLGNDNELEYYCKERDFIPT